MVDRLVHYAWADQVDLALVSDSLGSLVQDQFCMVVSYLDIVKCSGQRNNIE